MSESLTCCSTLTTVITTETPVSSGKKVWRLTGLHSLHIGRRVKGLRELRELRAALPECEILNS